MSVHADAAKLVLAAFAAGEVDVLDQLHCADYVDHSPLLGHSTDSAGLRERAMVLSSAFYDTRVDTEVLVDDGDTVVCSTRSRGVHKGSFLGVAATGRQIEMVGLCVFRFTDGLVSETWSSFELLGLFEGLPLAATRSPELAARSLASAASF
jgi:predicted ester cyclase